MKGTPMSVSEKKLEEFRAAITHTKDLVTELIQFQPEALKDPVIRYQLWRLRKELAGIDLDWSEEKGR